MHLSHESLSRCVDRQTDRQTDTVSPVNTLVLTARQGRLYTQSHCVLCLASV